MAEKYVVAVGSVHNGLIAAAFFAKAGKKMLVIERNGLLGICGGIGEAFIKWAVTAETQLSQYSGQVRRDHIFCRDLHESSQLHDRWGKSHCDTHMR